MIPINTKLAAPGIIAGFSALLVACTLPFGGGPKDIKVTSVSNVDYKDQTQIDFVDHPPHPSKIITRIDFTTNTDLLALSIKKEYNVWFAVGLCNKDGVKESIRSFGQLYSDQQLINFNAKASAEYSAAIAKGPPYTYQVYVDKLNQVAASNPLCFTLAGGNMLGGKLRSNDAVIPNQ